MQMGETVPKPFAAKSEPSVEMQSCKLGGPPGMVRRGLVVDKSTLPTRSARIYVIHVGD